MNNKNNKLNTKICLKIKLERMKRNLSQEQLAEMADLSRITIGKIERAEVSPTIESLEKIAKAFEMDFSQLIDISKVEL
ncbi:helix-turn-helix transcriptional regulator [bacterium]|nr:helix-turn-helix transcriptional regulator [bacterium]